MAVEFVDGVRVSVMKPKVALAVHLQMHHRHAATDESHHVRAAADYLNFPRSQWLEQTAEFLDNYHSLTASEEAVARRLKHASVRFNREHMIFQILRVSPRVFLSATKAILLIRP